MCRSERTALFSTLLLPLIAVTVLGNAPAWWVMLLAALIPMVLVMLVIVVLRDRTGPAYPDLPPGHEWGYQDRTDIAPHMEE